MESSRLTLEITNTGQVPADFSFIPKLHETNYSKDWLSIRPYRDCILPGKFTYGKLLHSDWLANVWALI